MNGGDLDIIVQECLALLEKKVNTHPNVTKMWKEYLLNKVTTGKATEEDIYDCQVAIDAMNTMPDIQPEMLLLIKFMLRVNDDTREYEC